MSHSAPTRYQIVVHGNLDEQWSQYLGGARIEQRGTPDFPLTVLSGEFEDQAALLGILNTLYDLRLNLLSYTSDYSIPRAKLAC
jgi:hypothetical protein